MKKTSQEYAIGKSTVVVRIGDILDSNVNVIVSSDDHRLTMSGGVSKAIRNKGGQTIHDEAQRYLTKLGKALEPGDVIQTDSGALPYLKVFHAVSRYDGRPPSTDFETTRDCIERAVTTSLKMLELLNAEKIAFPVIGAGYAQRPPQDVATVFANTLGPILRESQAELYVEIVLFPDDMPKDIGYLEFFRQFDAQANWKEYVVRDHVVVLVHGIRTPATWHEAVERLLRNTDNSVDPININNHVNPVSLGYGYFDLISFLVPSRWIRQSYIREIAEELTRISQNKTTKRLSIIAHSFGTYLVAHALKQANVNVSVLILCGSIVPRKFPWHEFGDRLAVIDQADYPGVQILNDCGWRDIWPVFAHTITWGYGSTGRFGFRRSIVKDRFHDLDHSEFFTADHVKRFWIPAIIEGRIVPQSVDAPNDIRVWILSLLTRFHMKWLIAAVLVYALVRHLNGS